MTTPRLSRYLMGIFALCYVSATAVIIWFSAVSAPSPAMATAFVAVPPASCPKTGPTLAKGLFQDAIGTIKSVSGQTLQIVSKTPGPTISATYSSTTHITQQTLVTTSPASVLLKGIDVSIQATPNPNGTFTATSITLMQSDQQQSDQPDDKGGCFGNNGPRQRSATSAGAPGGPSNKPAVPKPSKPSNPPAGGQPDNRSCFGGPTQKPDSANLSTQSSKTQKPSPANPSTKTSCRANGTVVLLKGNILTITDRQHTSHTITLTSGTNGTKITRVAPATPSALKAGLNITVMGPTTKGVITASRITIGSLPIIPSF